MDSELMRYANGEVRPRVQDRAVVRQAKSIYDDVRLADFEARGLMALRADIAEGLRDLHELAKKLAGDDPGLNAVMAQIFMDAVQDSRDIANSLHRPPARRLSWLSPRSWRAWW